VLELPPRRPHAAGDVAQQRHRVGSRPRRIGVGEQQPDVAQAGGAEQRVDDRVGEHVGVGVTGQAGLVRDLDAAEHEPPPGGEPVRVDADAGADAHPIGSSRRERSSNTHSSRTPASSSSRTASS
jgi:hypothetical protein